jgi:hypothetical protein
MKTQDITGLGLIKATIERVENQKSRFSEALKKLVNSSEKNLIAFLGEVLKQFGRLLKIVADISLEATVYLNTREFFRTKDKGGIFGYVDSDIFSWLETEIKNSPAKELASYEFTENITEEKIIDDAKTGGIYEEVDMAHMKQICERHILKGEKLLKEDGSANLFWVRNKKGGLCKVYVYWGDVEWNVRIYEFYASFEWDAGGRSFFRN